MMDKLVKARKKEMNDKKVIKGTPVHYEEMAAGFIGTDALCPELIADEMAKKLDVLISF